MNRIIQGLGHPNLKGRSVVGKKIGFVENAADWLKSGVVDKWEYGNFFQVFLKRLGPLPSKSPSQ